MAELVNNTISGGGFKPRKPEPKKVQLYKEGGKKADQIYEKEMAHKNMNEVPNAERELENIISQMS